MKSPPTTSTRERGSTLVEFALAVTALMTLIVGMIDIGRGLYTNHWVSNAARLATRYASVRGSACPAADCPATASSIQTYVRNLGPELNQAQITVNSQWITSPACYDGAQRGPGCYVQVTVSYPFKFAAVPIVPSFTMTMTSTSKMIISQ
jgi:Flp pilus assembly protein TadG